MQVASILWAVVISAALTALIIPKVILISFRKNLFDTVDERKVHSGRVPRLGGVVFTPVFILSIALLFGLGTLFRGFFPLAGFSPLRMGFCLCALLLIYMEGITDDLIGVGYRSKFAFQVLCSVMVVVSGVWVNNLYGLFGLYELPAWVGMPFTVVLLVYLINAVNLIDGIDGLASSLCGVAFFFLGTLFFVTDDLAYALLSFTMLGTLLPFFCFNVFGSAEKRSKIFMGDCGSQTIGLVLGLLAVYFSMWSPDKGRAGMPSALLVAFTPLMIPCLDVVRVMWGRIRRHQNPFLPDRTHIHHKFMRLGMSVRTALVVILMFDAFFILLNMSCLDRLNVNIVFWADVAIWCVVHVWLSMIISKRG